MVLMCPCHRRAPPSVQRKTTGCGRACLPNVDHNTHDMLPTTRSLRRRALPAAHAPTGVLAPATALAAAIGSC
eukprot:CAMPEP_0177526192 /NCGR_PEP_ID=MMETSP0369-20130122/50953_1 /TAXON_ID=447022 ORGANISM="Scrippsiella hangoei-like, Strain SHHI-4" /NCGR_SAMPLE_ID=MMETSP0369 /ASSEMBLY_ACC=CAM_ASM_000364 /LENGTH=72 /DNA_ID=CAMNT_0019006401 /DNA_START=247 /DNA_END=462 /DNA_ORIENTATION=-